MVFYFYLAIEARTLLNSILISSFLKPEVNEVSRFGCAQTAVVDRRAREGKGE